MRALRSLRGAAALVLLSAFAACATTAPQKKYGWGGQPSSGGGAGLPSGTGLVKVTSGVGALAVAGTDYTDASDWYSVQAKFLKTQVPQLTTCVGFKFGSTPGDANSTAGVDANCEGGCFTTTNNGWVKPTRANVFQAPKTGYWGVVFRGKMAPGGAGVGVAYIGIANAANNKVVVLTQDPALSLTKWTTVVTDNTVVTNVTATNLDAATHDFGFVGDGTNTKWFVDSTQIDTRVAANLEDVSMTPAEFTTNNATAPPKMIQGVYCYVGL